MATMKYITCNGHGDPDVLAVAEGPRPSPKEGEILVRVVACGINRAETLQRKGKYPAPPGASEILGLEAVGYVAALGAGVTEPPVDSRVAVLLAGGGYAEYVAVPAQHAMVIPDGIDWLSAAAIPEVWLTAYQLLHLVGNVKSGDTVLIHAGGSGVGLAAIQLAVAIGATPIITAGSELKIQKAIEMGAAQGFLRHGDWVTEVKQYTSNEGVSLVLDCVGQDYWEKNCEVLAKDGTWVLYGLLSGGAVNGNMLAKILGKRIQLKGTTLRARTNEYKTKLVQEFAAKCMPLFASKKFKTVVDGAFSMEQAAEAHKRMESNSNIGKLIIKIDEREFV
eukprot:m.57131 g.57131  ORF g.57131 m.57131 type:complete len:335 (+) comp11080_c0_seq1:98-1102(+)